MNEISFVYYGEPSDIESPLLKKLNIFEFRSRSEERSGLFVIERKFGQEITQRAHLGVDIENSADSAMVIYRFLSVEEQALLKQQAALRKVYILCHNFLNIEHILKNSAGSEASGSFNFIVTGVGDDFKPESWVSSATNSKKIFILQRPRPRESANMQSEAGSKWKLPLFLTSLFRLVLNPLGELDRYMILLKYSNLRFLSRTVELGLFFGFLIKFIFNIFYWNLRFVGGVLRVIAIKAGYLIRHILLMCGFKSFGFFVDSYQLLMRLLSEFRQLFYYKTIHAFYHKKIKPVLTHLWVKYLSVFVFDIVLGFYYRVLVRFYYRVLVRFYYRVVVRAAGYVWEKFISVIVFDLIVANFYHKIIRKIFAFLWVHVFSVIIFDVIMQFFHKVIRPIWTFFWTHVLSVLIFDVILQFFHKVVRPAWTFLWIHVLSVLIFDVTLFIYHKVIRRFLTIFWISVLSPLIFDVLLKGMYILIGAAKRGLVLLRNFIVYDIRHFVLMAYYKAYGVAIDFALFGYRITKLYILYPVRKIYWFCEFQYRKRIKKNISQ